MGEVARPAPGRDRGHDRVRPAAEARLLRRPRPVRLLHGAQGPRRRARRRSSPSRSTSTSPAASSSPSGAPSARELDALHEELDAADPKAEDYIVYRIFDVLTDAFYPIIELLEERIDALEGQVLLGQPRQEQLAEIYRLKQRIQELARRVVPQRDRFIAGAEVDPQPARARARRARVPARRRRPPRADRRRAAPPAGGPHGAHRDLLQRQREPPQQRRHAADDRRHVLPRLDAGDRLLRPELRLAGRQHRHPATTS